MRPLLATLLLAALTAPPATAGVITVDPFMQTVETSRFKLTFDYDRPEFLRTVVFKDFHPYLDLAGEDGRGREFWGQTRRGVDSTGFVLNDQLETHEWQVLDSFGLGARIGVWSQSPGQPPVSTTYIFLADQPWYVVERTVHFGQHPDSAAYQAYAARVSFLSSYRALRWRDVTGAYVQRGYCFGGCLTQSWDGRWLEHISVAATGSFSVAQIYPGSMPPGTPIVRGSGAESLAGWVAPLVAAGPHDTDATSRVMVAFSTTPGDTASLDSLWAFFNADGAWTLDVPRAAPPAPPRLAVTPNPAAGPARIAWTMAAPARATLEVLDVGGRRIATLFEGEAAEGPHARSWSGRDALGRAAPPGVYLARLVTPGAVSTARIVRVR